MKRTWYKITFSLIKKISIELLTGLVNRSNHTKCMTRPTLINLHLNEYSVEFHYCLIAVKLDRYIGSCSTFNDLSKFVFQIKQMI